MAVINMMLSPFLFVFLAIHFFLRNAEQLYQHPSSVGARRWAPLARWRLREFNELPHYIDHRCAPARSPDSPLIILLPLPGSELRGNSTFAAASHFEDCLDYVLHLPGSKLCGKQFLCCCSLHRRLWQNQVGDAPLLRNALALPENQGGPAAVTC